METLVFSLLRRLTAHLVLFALVAVTLFYCVSFSHIWQNGKAPIAPMADIKAPDEETATDAEIGNYIRLLDSQLTTYVSTLSATKDPAQRVLLEERIQRLSDEWCKFMRIRTGRNYEMWRLNYNWVGRNI